MLHERCYRGLRVLLQGEPVTIRTVRPTSIIVEDDNEGMIAADASELTPTEDDVAALGATFEE